MESVVRVARDSCTVTGGVPGTGEGTKKKYYRNKICLSRCQECTPHTTPSASYQLEHSLTNNLTSSTIYFVPSSFVTSMHMR